MDLSFFEKVSLFQGLSREELKEVMNYFQKLEISEGEDIIKEDDIGNEMYILYKGTVQITKNLILKTSRTKFTREDKTFITLDERSHSFFGEVGLLMNDKRSATVKALTPCVLYYIDRDNFQKMCDKNYKLGYIIMRNIAIVLAQRLKRNNIDILKLTTALSIALKK